MTNQEFSDQFDVLYNNITSNLALGLDNYEKSVFLTKALLEIVKSYFNSRLNKSLLGFDGDEKRLIDFSKITKTKIYKDFSGALFDNRSNSKRVTLDGDIMMLINEFVDVSRGDKTVRLVVIPISYKEYQRVMLKPYKRPLKYLAWRIIDSDDSNNQAELIIGPGDTLLLYCVRYVKRPNAIILDNLDGVTINDLKTNQGCELDESLHPEILLRAVELAKAAYMGDLQSQIALGTNSETNMGILTT